MTSLLLFALSAAIDVPAGADLAAALGRARPGDVVVLAAGVHQGALGHLRGATVRGAGAGVTFVAAPEGEPGAVASGEATLEALTLRAGPKQCALVVEGGTVVARDVALAGGGCGARVAGGHLGGDRVDLAGERHGLLVEDGSATISGGTLRGGVAGLAVRGGTASVSSSILSGAAREAAVAVTGGEATLEDVAIASRGPIGIAVTGGRLTGRAVTVRGPAARAGDGTAACVEALGGEVALRGSDLSRCGGPGVLASGAQVRLDGVDVSAGSFDCVALDGGARAELQGVRCETHGAGLVAAGGGRARLRLDSWLADPVFVVDCASGARVTLLYGETSREPCTSSAASPAR